MKFNFFRVQEGNNIVRFLTTPVKCLYHVHENKISVCFAAANRCFYCVKNEYVKSKESYLIGIKSTANDNRYIFKVPLYLANELKKMVLNHGNPLTYYDINLFCEERNNPYGRITPFLINKTRRAETDKELLEECFRLSNPLKTSLEECKSLGEFKDLYMRYIQSFDDSIIHVAETNIKQIVEKDYPQYWETLKKLILFS